MAIARVWKSVRYQGVPGPARQRVIDRPRHGRIIRSDDRPLPPAASRTPLRPRRPPPADRELRRRRDRDHARHPPHARHRADRGTGDDRAPRVRLLARADGCEGVAGASPGRLPRRPPRRPGTRRSRPCCMKRTRIRRIDRRGFVTGHCLPAPVAAALRRTVPSPMLRGPWTNERLTGQPTRRCPGSRTPTPSPPAAAAAVSGSASGPSAAPSPGANCPRPSARARYRIAPADLEPSAAASPPRPRPHAVRAAMPPRACSRSRRRAHVPSLPLPLTPLIGREGEARRGPRTAAPTGCPAGDADRPRRRRQDPPGAGGRRPICARRSPTASASSRWPRSPIPPSSRPRSPLRSACGKPAPVRWPTCSGRSSGRSTSCSSSTTSSTCWTRRRSSSTGWSTHRT